MPRTDDKTHLELASEIAEAVEKEAGWVERKLPATLITEILGQHPFIAPKQKGHSLNAWKAHMAALAHEMHARSHELNKSYGALPGPACAEYVDFAHRLHDALAYFYNCNSNPSDKFLEFDKQEMAQRLEWAAGALKRNA